MSKDIVMSVNHNYIKLVKTIGAQVALIVLYKFGGMGWVATALICGTVSTLGWRLMRRVKITRGSWALSIVVIASCALTLVTDDVRYVTMKPTVIYLGLATVLLVNTMFNKTGLIVRNVFQALENEIKISQEQWLRMSWLWVAFFVIAAATNEGVRRCCSEVTWVYYKTVGVPIAIFVFALLQLLVLLQGNRRAAK